MITDDQLESLIRLEAKATKGPWNLATVSATVGKGFHVFVYVPHLGEVCSCSPNSGLYSNRCGLDNLDFIAAIRNAAPSLLAELRASRELIAKLPRTADGKPIYPDMELWYWWTPQYSDGEPTLQHKPAPAGPCAPHECYSTREAALASKER